MNQQKKSFFFKIAVAFFALIIFSSDIFAQTTIQNRMNEGNAAFDLGRKSGKKSDFLRALTIFQEIRKEKETPYSVQLELQAKIVATHQALGQDLEAVLEFLLLCRTDSSVQFIDEIPLFWSNREMSTANARLKTLESAILPWLEPINNPSQKWNPVGQLLAASVLLFSDQYRQQAIQILQNLVVLESPDPENVQTVEFCRKISLLATAQLWRQKLIQPTLKESDVDFWQKTLQRFPVSLKYGPYFLIGEGYRKLKNDKALDAYLRLAILYPEKRTLAEEALDKAAKELEQRGQNRESNLLRIKLNPK
ncbi:MAG: hypothetical protein Q4C95_06345 [Planctomycetia bacterium]|nr:hypothetical protein [Planctomycetia bacterium]